MLSSWPDFKEAYRIIDLLDLYKERVTAPTITLEQIQIASQEFLHTLNGKFHGDVENNAPSQNFDPLIKLYVPYSKFDPTENNHQNIESDLPEESLLSRTATFMQRLQRQNGYRAIGEDDDENNFPIGDLSPLSLRQPANTSSNNTGTTADSSQSWFSDQNSDSD